MVPFTYTRAASLQSAAQELARDPAARIIAGGTNLIDLMKYDVERPGRLIDITRIAHLDAVTPTEAGGVRIGAMARNSDLAYDPQIQRHYPLLTSALLHGASPQLRNAATAGGNLMQRTRCYYFYDTATPCNKRQPGAGCSAIGGLTRIHAVLGASASCIATNPSDMNVALAALDATVLVTGPHGERAIPIAQFHRLPGDTPQFDTTLARDEIICAIELPAEGFAAHYTYLKLRDRQSYAFALISVAAGLILDEGMIATARIAMGGVAHKPWRVREAEALLEGRPPSDALFAEAGARLMQDAVAQTGNGFKIELGARAVKRALWQAAAGTPQPVAQKRVV